MLKWNQVTRAERLSPQQRTLSNPPFPSSDIARGSQSESSLYLWLIFSHCIIVASFPPTAIVPRQTYCWIVGKTELTFPHLKGRFSQSWQNRFTLHNVSLCVQLCFNLAKQASLSRGHSELKQSRYPGLFSLCISVNTLWQPLLLECNPTMSCSLIREGIGAVWR